MLTREQMSAIILEELSRHTNPPINRKEKLTEKIVKRLDEAQMVVAAAKSRAAEETAQQLRHHHHS